MHPPASLKSYPRELDPVRGAADGSLPGAARGGLARCRVALSDLAMAGGVRVCRWRSWHEGVRDARAQ